MPRDTIHMGRIDAAKDISLMRFSWMEDRAGRGEVTEDFAA